ncbi:hypothetical protein TSMEX_003218, partial [Taenia solium]
ESSVDVCDEIPIATSDTAPTFAKIRHSIDVQDVSQIWNLHELKYIPCDIAFQQLNKLFETSKPTDSALTSDFCMWSAPNGQGINDLFGRISFEGERHGGNFTCFLDIESDSDG